MKKILFIINPIAGTKARRLTENHIKELFSEKDFDVTIIHTTHPGHAVELAKQSITDKINLVVIAGGDGSINEVGSVLRNSDVQLGIVPCGSGNGLAHHLNIPMKIDKALEVIKSGIVQNIDVGMVKNDGLGEKCFFSNCGFGYDAEVIHAYDKVEQRGFFTYLFFMFKSITTLRPKEVTITFHEFSETLRPFVFTVANSSQYGYKIEVAPEASISDGLLDALLVRDASFLRVLKFSVLSMLKLRDHILDVADFYKAKDILINFKEETKLQIDGEAHFVAGDVEISIEPQTLQVLIPNHL